MSGRVLTVAQQKGGSGKTTVAVNLAVAFARAGRSAALLDTDPQGSLGRWFMTRCESGDPGMDFGTSSAWGVSYECGKLRKQHDLVIVDTPPKADSDLRPAIRECDLVIVPVASSQVDVWATESVLDLARRERRRALVVLNRASTGCSTSAGCMRRSPASTPRASAGPGSTRKRPCGSCSRGFCLGSCTTAA